MLLLVAESEGKSTRYEIRGTIRTEQKYGVGKKYEARTTRYGSYVVLILRNFIPIETKVPYFPYYDKREARDAACF